MRKIYRAALGAGFLLVGSAMVSACSKTEAGLTNGAAEVATAERRNLEIQAEAVGLVEPIRIVEVKSKASGEVLELVVETGDFVDRGALLAEIDPRDVRNAYLQAQADLEVAEARQRTSKAQLERADELRAASVITEQEYESAQLDLANANTQLVKAQTTLELAEERMNDVRITAPTAGTIITKSVEVGTIIASASQNVSGGTTLLEMADLSKMHVRTLVDETDMGSISPGMPARVTVAAHPNRPFVGNVLKIEPQAVVEQNVTMFPVLIELDNREGLLKPGMNGEVAIEIARRENVVTVPNAAVVSMRDAAAAGMVLGLSEEDIRSAMGGAGMMMGGRPGGPGAPGGPAVPGAGESAEKGQPDAAMAGLSEECAALMAKARTDRESLTEEERTKLRSCAAEMGGRTGMGRDTENDTRAGVVFVQKENGPELRRVILGVNDWDHTEIVQGLEAGERVVLMSVARIQQQQQQMLDRMRQMSGGPFPGSGGRR